MQSEGTGTSMRCIDYQDVLGSETKTKCQIVQGDEFNQCGVPGEVGTGVTQ